MSEATRTAWKNAALILVCTAALMAATQIERPSVRALAVVMGACLQSLLVLNVEAALVRRKLQGAFGHAASSSPAVVAQARDDGRPEAEAGPLPRRAVTGDPKVSVLGTCACGGRVWLAREPPSLVHEDPACEFYRRTDGTAYLRWLKSRRAEGTAGPPAEG